MNERKWLDFEDGVDEDTLWDDEDFDLERDVEFGDRWDLDEDLDLEVMEKRHILEAFPRRHTPGRGKKDRAGEERRQKRKRDFENAWGTPY